MDKTASAAFDRDIEQKGGYQYTDGTRLSALLANRRYTQEILKAADFTGKSVVDVGSGDGTYTAELAKLSAAASVLGIEPSAKAVERAQAVHGKAHPHLKFVCGSSEALLRAATRFDIAVYRGVIHHVDDPRAEVGRAVALARTVIILEPNGLNPLMKLAEKLSAYHRQHRERSFAPRTLCRWIVAAGGEVQRLRLFGLVPYFSPDWVARLGQRLEPVVEPVPVVRAVGCGQYVIVAGGRP